MKKLGINTAAAIMDIIGASIYLIALLTALITYDMDKNIVFDIFFLILRGFAIGGGIVVLISYILSKKANMRLYGQIMGLIGHISYALGGKYLTLISLVLCILGAVFTLKDNHID